MGGRVRRDRCARGGGGGEGGGGGGGGFHFDPVPHLMRDFVSGRDVDLRRTGENLSAALQNLERTDRGAFEEITDLVSRIADDRVQGISFVSSDLGDVMLALEEVRGSSGGMAERTPARQMSDGLLRFIGIATALLSSQHGLDVDNAVGARPDQSDEGSIGGVLIVLEELENGLHPSQLTRLTDLPGYATALAEGTLGVAVTAGKLIDSPSSRSRARGRILSVCMGTSSTTSPLVWGSVPTL
ncbi:hypothetical protein C5C21_07450 [Rathayibacter tritici]|nr:hypothetical protein C5C21_07450 [Rathayibacter tritici]